MTGQGFVGAPWLMLSLNPERSAMIRKKPGGRSQVDLVTTAGMTTLDEWGGGTTTIPVTKAATATINPTNRTTADNFLRETIQATCPHGF
ncbi:MAG: hypothetical protein ABSF00_04260 [Candidatus Bathyarchaeia archaeon]